MPPIPVVAILIAAVAGIIGALSERGSVWAWFWFGMFCVAGATFTVYAIIEIWRMW